MNSEPPYPDRREATTGTSGQSGPASHGAQSRSQDQNGLKPEDPSLFAGTMDVPERHRFDTPALEAWLRERLPNFEGPLEVEIFKGGQSNPTYKLITPSKTWVMRAKPGPVVRLLPSAHAIEREYRVLDALAQTDVPVARVHCLCEDESVIGRAFYVMDFVEGRVFWDPSLPDLSASQRSAIFDEMNRVIAALHTIDAAAVGLGDYGRPGNYFARQIARWTRQYQASETRKIEEMDRLIQWLPAHIPNDETSSIVHGDFRLDNMIFDPSSARVRAVLDWELSTLGHPLADFAYHCMAWRIPPGMFRGLGGLDLSALSIPDESRYVERYCERTGMSASLLARHWEFSLAYNMFRLAAILQGIVKRVSDGTASNTQAPASAARIGPLAEMGWAIARQVR
jgi:aminoglycoside phosphotransferase (APT) family kinase protein